MLNILPTVKKTNSFYTSAVDIIYMHLAPTSRASALRDGVRRGCLGFISVSSYRKMIDRVLLLIILLPCVCGWSNPSLHRAIIYRTSLTDSTALSSFLFSAWAPLVVSPPQDR